MLADIGLSSLDQLFEVVPAALRLAGGLDMAPGLSEPDVLAEMERLAGRNRTGADLVCFAGAGAYDHEVPSATKRLTFRSEFVTAYTPYQPEVAQGVLQALFEYQTLVARLAGLPIANASLYDGASAAVEAVNLAVAANGRQTVWVSGGIHPHWRQVLATFARGHRPPARRRAAPRRGHRLVGGPGRRTAGRPAGRFAQLPRGPGGHPRRPGGRRRARRPGAGRLRSGVRRACCGRPARTAPTWWWGRGSRSARRCRSAVRTWGCSPAGMEQVRRLPGRLVGRRPSTPRAARPT